ncbi:murein hydrolase activator EnvC family protein [Sphingorhabdus sp.]|jgi:septal ring factor EnvC (AmiA/AmiB activator)|uniref:murein hydrolase activator EnvC family protein n=1 Tax=Sphingorhabdus sp. TaxID=1902408 RepID=UPI0037C660B3
MRFWLTLATLILAPLSIAGGLMAQEIVSDDAPQNAMRALQDRALTAERRSELLRQEASNAQSTADRFIAQRAVLSAEIDAAEAQIDTAAARVGIISRSQKAQRADYIHLRAIMATVQPAIMRKTSALRQQIAAQSELEAQEVSALKSLRDARGRLTNRHSALAAWEGDILGNNAVLSANAAIAFEQAIAQGERARDIVGRIDNQRLSATKAAELAALDGPFIRPGHSEQGRSRSSAYILPAAGQVVAGFSELNVNGYRERGIRLAVTQAARIVAPAGGIISFAGRYRSYSNIVIIEHGKGWNSLITNLDSVEVAKGQKIDQGALLGRAGKDGPEIGVELRKNGRVMDIAAMLG